MWGRTAACASTCCSTISSLSGARTRKPIWPRRLIPKRRRSSSSWPSCRRVINGGGFIDREYAVGRGRLDLCVRWPHPGGVERWAAELKVWRDRRADPLEEGLGQLAGYLARLGLDRGTLILFDARSTAASLPDRCSFRKSSTRDAGSPCCGCETGSIRSPSSLRSSKPMSRRPSPR